MRPSSRWRISRLIQQTIGFEQLNEGLAQIAELEDAVSGSYTKRIRDDVESAGGQIGSQSQTEKAECSWLTNCGRNKEENYYD